MLNNDSFYEYYSLICRTITTPSRLKIIETIGRNKMNVSQIYEATGLSRSNLSNHLGALYKIGVLGREKVGNFIYYYISHPEILKIIKMMMDLVVKISKDRHHFVNEKECEKNNDGD